MNIKLTSSLTACKFLSNLDHFEVFLSRAALRTAPTDGHILPTSAWGNTVFRPTGGLVIYQSAHEAHPTFEIVRVSHTLLSGLQSGASPSSPTPPNPAS